MHHTLIQHRTNTISLPPDYFLFIFLFFLNIYIYIYICFSLFCYSTPILSSHSFFFFIVIFFYTYILIISVQSKHEVASAYLDAATCYKKSNFVSAISALRQAIDIFTDEGRFTQAAKHTKEIAELYESEMDYENATTYFQVPCNNNTLYAHVDNVICTDNIPLFLFFFNFFFFFIF